MKRLVFVLLFGMFCAAVSAQQGSVVLNEELLNLLEFGQQAMLYGVGVELVDKATYIEKKRGAVSFLKADNAFAKSEDGIIRLPTGGGEVEFRDVPTDGDGMEEYAYLGRVELLNKYLVCGQFWEGREYYFVDRTSGEKTGFADFPSISPDKKFVLTLRYSGYEDDEGTHLWLGEISDAGIEGRVGLLFTHWMPDWLAYEEDGSMFWAQDGCFYLPVRGNIPRRAIWYFEMTDEERGREWPLQYARISLSETEI